MKPVAGPEEVQRVTNYIVLVWGTGTAITTDLTKLDIVSVEGSTATMTVTARETWSYGERDRTTGSVRKPQAARTQVLEYTLVRVGDRWIVQKAGTVEGPAP